MDRIHPVTYEVLHQRTIRTDVITEETNSQHGTNIKTLILLSIISRNPWAVKVKLSLHLITHHAMKTCGGMDVQFHHSNSITPWW
jgi:hypothetical protein